MSVTGIAGRSQVLAQRLVDMRKQLDDLQRQLATGQKSNSYAGLGASSGLGVALRAQLSGLSGYDQTMTTVGIRLSVAQSALTRMSTIASDAKTALSQPAVFGSAGQTNAQSNAANQLDELTDLLNSQVDGRYLFSGRNVDQPAVATSSQILDGDGARAGLRQMIDERRQADLGSSGLGRLTLGSAGSAATVAEDAAGSPFGFKLAAATTDITGATITGPAGSPPAITVDLGATNPQPGKSVTFSLNLPDGTSRTVKLTATTSSPPGAGEFTIGADATATAANLKAALGTSLSAIAGTELVAASAMAASNDFFSLDATHVPQRVDGPPFDTATALRPATASDTVFWYTGEVSADPARSSASARIDPNQSVDYGMRANEEGFRNLVQNVAVLAATTFSPTDPSSPAAYGALMDRVRPAMEGSPSSQKITDIAVQIGTAQAAIKSTQDRHQQSSSMLSGLLDQSEGVSTEEVAASMLALQTRLQASLQTTATLYHLNLTDYI